MLSVSPIQHFVRASYSRAVRRPFGAFYRPDEFWRIDPDAGLLPFGMRSDGNLYCFHTGAAEGASVPVVLLQYDHSEDLCLTPDLAGFVFDDTIEPAAEIDDVDSIVDSVLRYPARHDSIQLLDRSAWCQG
ncbi:hypothetical protein [Gulosibacter hominis]|uniref:hypothetical protein n=1 Tax=Gulosibacter hominis TaxID=2770504 RepID=UPI00191994DC|nr:hypothetical protein [Gulosibacter hominis]